MNNISATALRYLNAYQEKDLGTIEALISSDVELIDWNLAGKGREFFLLETKKNFDSQDSIKIEVLQAFEVGQKVAFQLIITVDRIHTLAVVDVISFDTQGKIKKVQAYKSL